MVLVYQAYGREDILRQTLFSVTSLLAVHNKKSNLQIWIYTDNPDYVSRFFNQSESKSDGLNALPVKIVEVNPQQIQKWRGEINFVHRVKLEILLDAAKKFSGSLFYADGDTYYHTDPTDLFLSIDDNTSLMHIAEYVLAEARDPLAKKIKKFFKRNKLLVADSEITVPLEMAMWNAGVIGLSERNKSLLNHMLEFTDKAYSLYQKHIMEQFAVSYYLQKNSQVIPAEKVIGHYWDKKELFQAAIDKFLNQNPTWEQARANYANFSWPAENIKQNERTSWLPAWFR